MKEKNFNSIAAEVGALTTEKNIAYGDSFAKCGEFLKLLYPNGVQVSQFSDALAMVRIFDKQMRIATRKDAFGESPYRDICGYGLLGIVTDENAKLDAPNGMVSEATAALAAKEAILKSRDEMIEVHRMVKAQAAEPALFAAVQARRRTLPVLNGFAIGDEVMVHDRFRFAVPLKARIQKFSDTNNGVGLQLLESNNPHYPEGTGDVWVHVTQIRHV